jgi:hypothetical protein
LYDAHAANILAKEKEREAAIVRCGGAGAGDNAIVHSVSSEKKGCQRQMHTRSLYSYGLRGRRLASCCRLSYQLYTHLPLEANRRCLKHLPFKQADNGLTCLPSKQAEAASTVRTRSSCPSTAAASQALQQPQSLPDKQAAASQLGPTNRTFPTDGDQTSYDSIKNRKRRQLRKEKVASVHT